MVKWKNRLNSWLSKRKGHVFILEDLVQEHSESEAIRKHLSRMTKEGRLNRLRKGMYHIPEQREIFNKLIDVPPSHSEIVNAISRTWKTKFVPSGPFAAHALGLTTQVPQHKVYLSKKNSYKEEIANQLIEIKKVSHSKMEGAGTVTATIFSALEYLQNELNQEQLSLIAKKLKKVDMIRLEKCAKNRSQKLQNFVVLIKEQYEKIH
ncbi:DUF6088 family protein [Lentisphaera profundi]|uniref:DUF6088 family protein n=1 Tax=Lentisphaera profundi TaxID=1658616 RepID=A0ABY7VXJ0_9BACT|nr:DUF6088 family protein [Lentisphaera profundi]WDE98943.1 DUF6088 family protein [Lentisphaera profundi]